VWPATNAEAKKIVVPCGLLYTPLATIEHMPEPLPYDPIRCKGCSSILNPHCHVDFQSKLWTCPYCQTRNQFPPHYAENISEQCLPAELIQQNTTVEYELPNRVAGPPVFVFVLDTCVSTEELDELKDSLQQTLNLLPEQALVGLVTFGTMVQVHEIGFADCPKSYVFKGGAEIPVQDIKSLLGLQGDPRQRAPAAGQQQGQAAPPGEAASRFLQPVSECGFALESILEDLQKDPWPVQSDQRALRCTGVAMSVAIGLLESTFPRQGARVMLFVGGPPTSGPGAIVDRARSEDMRSHTDITKDKTPHMKKAIEFYEGLAARAVTANHVIDIFACSLDQVGILEQKVCVEKTGGLMVLADSFGQSVFKESFRRVFTRFPDESLQANSGHMQMGFAANIEVNCSREIKIQGAIGPCSSLNKKNASVSENPIGTGGTCAWSMGGVDPNSTLAIYFEVVNKEAASITPGKRRHIQMVTQYQHASGRFRLRVTSTSGAWHTDPGHLSPVAASFDQEAAAILMARFAVSKTWVEETGDILRWVDRSLIRLCAKVADYRKDDPMSFRLSPEFSIYPQFMFHLRRSNFLQVFNCSPDESSYYRQLLIRENVTNSLVMIQPSLMSYSFQSPAKPVLLDATSVKRDTILLLDTFFHCVVFHGETIASWRDQNYQDQEDHVHFKDLLAAPAADAQIIMDSRFPIPRYIVCDQHKSQSRFLMAKLNPSVTHNSEDAAGEVIFTDDVSLKVFMEHLMKLSVQGS
jgi:protein transport protein SEC23